MSDELYLGIDQSYTSTGVVVLNNFLHIIDTQIIRSDPEEDIYERAWFVTQEVLKIVKVFRPMTIALEGLAFSKFGNATRDLAGLQFILVSQLRFVAKQDPIIVSPNLLKKFATTKGNAKKDEMVDALPKGLKEQFKKSYKKTKGLYDVTDAYWLARYIKDKQKS